MTSPHASGMPPNPPGGKASNCTAQNSAANNSDAHQGHTQDGAGQDSDKTCRLGVLLSGRGSNFAAIQQAIEDERLTRAEIAVVVSNRPEAPGLILAKEKGLAVVALTPEQATNRALRDAAIVAALREHGVDLVILAGYDRILGKSLLEAYSGRILNIHPSLLPAYGGKNMVGPAVHQAVLANAEAESGCTVHVVTEVVDGGAILGQSRVPVLKDDTPESLAARVLEQEHRLYPQVIQSVIDTHFTEKLRERGLTAHEDNIMA